MFEDSAFKAAEQFLKKSKAFAELTALSNDLARNLKNSSSFGKELSKHVDELVGKMKSLADHQSGVTISARNMKQFYDSADKMLRDRLIMLETQQNISSMTVQDAKVLLDTEKKRLAVMKAATNNIQNYGNIQLNTAGATKEQLEAAQQVLDNDSEIQKVQQDMLNLERARTAEQKARDEAGKALMLERIFGRLYTKFQAIKAAAVDFGKMIGLSMGPMLAIVALLAFLKKGIDLVRDGLKKTIDMGLGASQRFGEIGKAVAIMGESALKTRTLLNIDEVLESANQLQRRLGTLNIDPELVRSSAELGRHFNISAENSSKILEFLTRIRRQSGVTSARAMNEIAATAIANNANVLTTTEMLADNTDAFAKSARASAIEMAKAAINAQRLGVNMANISGLADRIVTDFEGTLEAQASIGAITPGFDMTGLLIASQFGTQGDIQRELQAAVDSLGTDFDSLPRSFKLAISSGIGISVEELANLMGQQVSLAEQDPGAAAIVRAASGGFNELQKALVSPLDSINRAVNGIWGILTSGIKSIFFGSGSARAEFLKAQVPTGEYAEQMQKKSIQMVQSTVPARPEQVIRESEARTKKHVEDIAIAMNNRPVEVTVNIDGEKAGFAIAKASQRSTNYNRV